MEKGTIWYCIRSFSAWDKNIVQINLLARMTGFRYCWAKSSYDIMRNLKYLPTIRPEGKNLLFFSTYVLLLTSFQLIASPLPFKHGHSLFSIRNRNFLNLVLDMFFLSLKNVCSNQDETPKQQHSQVRSWSINCLKVVRIQLHSVNQLWA